MAERSLVDILKDMVTNTQELIKGELRLARSGVSEEIASRWNRALTLVVKPALKPARLLLTGAVIGLFGIGYLLLAAVYALSLVVPAWAAATIVGGVLAIIAAGMVSSAMGKLRLAAERVTEV